MGRKTLILMAVAALAAFQVQAMADTSILGTAGNFAVLAGTSITNSGSTTLNDGDLGLSTGTSYPTTGISYSGTHGAFQDTGVGAAATAQADLTTAYNTLAGMAPTSLNDYTTFNSGDLNGLTLTPGTYKFSSTALLSVGGLLKLDFQGNPDAQFVFQVGSGLTAVSGSEVRAINFGTDENVKAGCNVFWQVTSSAGIGTNSQFLGHIVALTSITLDNGAVVNGSALARNGTVSMDSNTINNFVCDVTTGGGGNGTIVPAPSAAAAVLGLLPLLGLWFARRRFVRRRSLPSV